MRVLIDLNVVLDVILNRQPWVDDAVQIWNAHNSGKIDGFLAATEFTNLFYIVRRIAGEELARSAVRICLSTFGVGQVDQLVLENADRQTGIDFEDNVCIACAHSLAIDWIVTRDVAGFAASEVPIISPQELVALLASTKP